MTTALVAEHVEHFRLRVLQDAVQEATSAYWLRRADTFAQVGTPACDQIARACRNKATFLATYGLDQATRDLIHNARAEAP